MPHKKKLTKEEKEIIRQEQNALARIKEAKKGKKKSKK